LGLYICCVSFSRYRLFWISVNILFASAIKIAISHVELSTKRDAILHTHTSPIIPPFLLRLQLVITLVSALRANFNFSWLFPKREKRFALTKIPKMLPRLTKNVCMYCKSVHHYIDIPLFKLCFCHSSIRN